MKRKLELFISIVFWTVILAAVIVITQSFCKAVKAQYEPTVHEVTVILPVTMTVEPKPMVLPECVKETIEIEAQVTYIEEPKVEEVVEPLYTEEELDALALAIYQEAGGDDCSDETRLMVGTVILNRVADDRFPNTIQEVLTQEAQYGRLHWTGLVWPERASYPEEAYAVERAYDLAEALLSGGIVGVLPADVVWQAEFVQGTEIVVQTDGFYFCR